MSATLKWVTSSYSSQGNCVEVAGSGSRVLVRDTKDNAGPVLQVSAEAWRQLVARVKER
jgi:Domain of unknown function (DUF397)